MRGRFPRNVGTTTRYCHDDMAFLDASSIYGGYGNVEEVLLRFMRLLSPSDTEYVYVQPHQATVIR